MSPHLYSPHFSVLTDLVFIADLLLVYRLDLIVAFNLVLEFKDKYHANELYEID